MTATGGTPSNVTNSTVNSIAHEYASLSAAEAGASDANHINNTSLVAANVVLNIPCYYDTAAETITTSVVISGYTTGVNNYIKVYTPNNTSTECNQSQRHTGKWDDSKYRLDFNCASGNPYAIDVYVNYARLIGLQVKVTDSSHSYPTAMDFEHIDTGSGGEVIVSHNILWGNISGTATYPLGICVSNAAANPTFKIYNNIVYNFKIGSGSAYGIHTGNGTANTSYVYNNTVYNCYYGFITWSPATTVAKNNIAYNNTDNYNGTFDGASNYNLSGPSQTDAPGANSQNGKSLTFVNTTAGSEDLHLASGDTDAIDKGTNPFTTGLVGYWNLDENPAIHSTTIADSSGQGNNGTLSTSDGSTNKSITGQIGQAIDLDGTNDYVSIGDPADGDLDFGTGSFTLSVWVYQQAAYAPSNWGIPFWKGGSSLGAVGYDIEVSGGGSWYVGIVDGTYYRGADFGTEAGLLGKWSHLTAVMDRSATLLRAYLNGSQVDTDTLSGFGSVSNAYSANIGASYTGSWAFNGLIDDVRIYNRALSAAEVTELYNNFSFSDDIDGQSRPYGSAWDIGADECMAARRVFILD